MRLNAPEDSRVTPVDVVDNISTALGIAAQGLAATLAPAYVGALAGLLGLRCGACSIRRPSGVQRQAS
jgi:hypothetical protein